MPAAATHGHPTAVGGPLLKATQDAEHIIEMTHDLNEEHTDQMNTHARWLPGQSHHQLPHKTV
jgi:hypothetical protein